MAYTDEVLADSPIGYWRLGESSGPTCASEVNSPTLDGTAVNSPTFGVAGALGESGDSDTAVSFGASQYVSFTADALFEVGDVLTAEAWIKRAATGTTGRVIIDQGANSVYLAIKDSSDLIAVAKNGVAYIAQSTVAITDTSTWHHIVYTKNGSTNAIYIDGTDVTDLLGNQTLSNKNDFSIAAKLDDAGETGIGGIDEVAFYDTALSAARVLAHYRAGSGFKGHIQSQYLDYDYSR